jgi:hypothetical protein
MTFHFLTYWLAKSNFCAISICYLDVNWLIPKILACRTRIWSLLASERSERVTNFIFCRAGWYFSVSIIFTLNEWYICKLLMNYGFGEASFEYFESCNFFPRKYKYRCIRVCVWFKDDKHVIWMWIWLILKNISLLDRIWSLWLEYTIHFYRFI